MVENQRHADRLQAQLRESGDAMQGCDGRMDVATDDAKVQMLGDLADALRERRDRIERTMASVRSRMGLPAENTRADSSDWMQLHPRRRLAAGL